MNLPTIFEQIEGIKFQANLAVASGVRLFQLGLQTHETIRLLVSELKAAPQDRMLVYEHVLELLKCDSNPGYLNRCDIPIAAYLYVLSCVDQELAHAAARAVLKADSLKWAIRIADQVLETAIVP